MKKIWVFLFLAVFSLISLITAVLAAGPAKPTLPESSGQLFDFKDVGFVISASSATVIGEKGSRRLHLVLQHPVSFIISASTNDDAGQDLDKISLVPSGLEKDFLLQKDADFYIGNRNESPDAYLMFLDENGRKTTERIDVEKIQFGSDQVTVIVELEGVIPSYLIGSQTTNSMGLFLVSKIADISNDTAVYSRGKDFGALIFDLLDQRGESANALFRVKVKKK